MSLRRSLRTSAVAALSCVSLVALATSSASASVTPPSVSPVASYPLVAGQSGPLGAIAIAEAVPGQIHVGTVFTYQFSDATSGATLHFASAATVSGTNGLSATVALASSNVVGTPLLNEMKVTITAASSASAFPGVLTLAGLNAATDGGAALGADHVAVSDTQSVLGGPVTVSDATLVSAAALQAPYSALATPTILPTDTNQAIGDVLITEPAKSYFHTGDVITLTIRDANGSADTVGLASTPYAAGGSMTVAVSGINGPTVQLNDTSFLVTVTSGDPSQGSASTITVSNLVVNTAEAPLGAVMMSAIVTSGPDAGIDLIVPGAVAIATVGGNTTTIANGQPTLALSTTAQLAGNLSISATPGSIATGDTLSVQIQTTGVTFSSATPPIMSITSGSVVVANAAGTIDVTGTIASWKVTNGATLFSGLTIGPIYYDVSGAATAGQAVSVAVSAQAGSAFTSQIVANAVLKSTSSIGQFVVPSASVPTSSVSPFVGAPISFIEPSSAATPVGSVIAIISPYATQIAAYRTTFAAVPTASATNGLTLSAGHVNSTAIVIATPQGTITAPAQTVATFTVTGASSAASTVTINAPSFSLGDLVQPGALVVQGILESSGALSSSLGGNQVVDLVSGRGLGSSPASTPPTASFTQFPPSSAPTNRATFAFTADQSDVTFACALDTVVVSLKCPSPITLPSLTEGSHTFVVQAFNAAGFAGPTASYTWTVDTQAPTAVVAAPTSVSGPVTVTFSEPVIGIGASSATLSIVPASGPAVAVATTLTCTTALAVSESCSTLTTYVSLSIQPTAALVPGEHYELVLNPLAASPLITDGATNALAITTVDFRGSLKIDQNSPIVIVHWRAVPAASAPGGSYTVEHSAGATAAISFTGTSVTWKTMTGPSFGRASVAIDHVVVGQVNNFSPAVHANVAHTYSGLVAGVHTIVVTVLGSKGAPAATDTLVAIGSFTVNAVVTPSSSPLVIYSWHVANAAAATSGSYTTSDERSSTTSLTFRGTAVTWVTVSGPSMGRATIYIDGVKRATVDNFSAATHYRVLRTVSGLTDAEHTIRIVVTGEKNALSKGTAVADDGFAVL